jgi:hypothetical protein
MGHGPKIAPLRMLRDCHKVRDARPLFKDVL